MEEIKYVLVRSRLAESGRVSAMLEQKSSSKMVFHFRSSVLFEENVKKLCANSSADVLFFPPLDRHPSLSTLRFVPHVNPPILQLLHVGLFEDVDLACSRFRRDFV
jgi:hypothetical protein